MLTGRAAVRAFTIACACCESAAAGCASTRLDVGAVEERVRDTYGTEGGRPASSVECPGDVVVGAGRTFESDVSFADGGTARIEVRMTDDRGSVEWHFVG